MCSNTSVAYTLYFAGAANAVPSPGPAQTQISTLGPMETAFDVYEDFFSYCGGIYQ